MGDLCWMVIRWFGVSIKPPVPITDPCKNLSNPTSKVSAVTFIVSSSETSYARKRSGSTWIDGTLTFSPQIGTSATPGTRSKRALIFQ